MKVANSKQLRNTDYFYFDEFIIMVLVLHSLFSIMAYRYNGWEKKDFRSEVETREDVEKERRPHACGQSREQ